jgi:transposase
MPVSHVALAHGLSWGSVRRAEGAALARWDARRVEPPLHQVGVDEKFLGRRHHLAHRFVTIVSNLETGEPLWIGPHRREATLEAWLAGLSPEAKARIRVFAMDMHQPFANAVRADPDLAHAAIVHDPFHIMKRAGEAMDEVRRDVFFRAGAEMRRVGRGTRWLVLRAWSKTTDDQRAELRRLFSYNARLARAYQVVEELRDVLRAPDGAALAKGLAHILLRTERRANIPMRKLHDSLVAHWKAIVALGEHRPPTGRIEALNNNWEALVRRGRGYRDHAYLLLKLRFMTANPLRDPDDARRFLALELPQPMPRVA